MSAIEFYDHLWGSGATAFPWWAKVEGAYANGPDKPSWPVTVTLVDPEFPEEGESEVSISRSAVEDAVRLLLHGEKLDEWWSAQLRLLLRSPGDADVDASLADVVLQTAALGKVMYA